MDELKLSGCELELTLFRYSHCRRYDDLRFRQTLYLLTKITKNAVHTHMDDISYALKVYSVEDPDRRYTPHDIPKMVKTLSSKECQRSILIAAQRAARGFAGLAKTLRHDATPYRQKIRDALQHLVV